MPDEGPDLQPPALRQRRAAHQGDRRDPAPARLHGRLPDDDRPGDVHHQRGRAGRRVPARPLAGRLLQRHRGPHERPDAVQRQGHPEPGRLARVRDEQQGPPVGQGRPQAQDRRDDPAPRRRLRVERGDRRAVRQRRHRSRPSVHRGDARQGPHEDPAGRPDRGLQEAPPGRPADRRQRPPARREPVLQLPPLRPRPGRPLQVRQEARRGRRPDGDRAAARRADDHPRGHRRDRRPPDRAQHRGPEAARRAALDGRRHRPPRQPPDPGQRRADPERVPDRAAPDGARRPRADDDPGDRQGHPERAHQHPARRGRDEGVLRRQPAVAVHGPDQPAGRAHQQAPPVGPRAGRPVARARRVRRPRRPPQPLRPDLPDRDPRGSEHRPHRLARDVRPDQQLRLHRDPLPQGQADGRLGRPEGAHVRGRRRSRREVGARSSSRPAQPFTDARRGRAQEAEGPGVPDPADRERRDRVPARRRGGAARRRPGERAARRGRPLHRRAGSVALSRPVPRGAAEPDRVHGRVAEAGRVRGHRAHPVPRARRREPCAHGLEHAAPGRPAPRARGADRRHRDGGPRRTRLGPGPHRPRRRRRHERHRRAGPDRDRRRRARRVPAPEVRPLEPGDVHQPAPDRRRRHAGRRRPTRSPTRARPTTASSPSAGTCSSRS